MSFHKILTEVPEGGYVQQISGAQDSCDMYPVAKCGDRISIVIVAEPGYVQRPPRIVTRGNQDVFCCMSIPVAGAVAYVFDMPDDDIRVKCKFVEEDDNIIKEAIVMNPNEKKVIDHFEIPEELATELSDLLTRQTIRERLLAANTNDPVKFNEIEDMLVPITAKIEAIKMRITKEFVPEKYQDEKYSWNYDGWEVAKNMVQVLG